MFECVSYRFEYWLVRVCVYRLNRINNLKMTSIEPFVPFDLYFSKKNNHTNSLKVETLDDTATENAGHNNQSRSTRFRNQAELARTESVLKQSDSAEHENLYRVRRQDRA